MYLEIFLSLKGPPNESIKSYQIFQLAEPIRMLLIYTGTEFEDKR